MNFENSNSAEIRRLKGILNDNGVYKQIEIIEAGNENLATFNRISEEMPTFFIQLSVLHHELSSHHLSALRRIIL
jgi:hypothetical protein